MTDKEKAIVMAYTGVCMLSGDKLGIYYNYIYEKCGKPFLTHEYASESVEDMIKSAARPDFLALCDDTYQEEETC